MQRRAHGNEDPTFSPSLTFPRARNISSPKEGTFAMKSEWTMTSCVIDETYNLPIEGCLRIVLLVLSCTYTGASLMQLVPVVRPTLPYDEVCVVRRAMIWQSEAHRFHQIPPHN